MVNNQKYDENLGRLIKLKRSRSDEMACGQHSPIVKQVSWHANSLDNAHFLPLIN